MNKITTFKKRVITQTYVWLLGKWELHKGWKPDEELWQQCPYNTLDLTRHEFNELIRQMKEEEGWV